MRTLAIDTGPSTGFCLRDSYLDKWDAWIEELPPGEQHRALSDTLKVLEFDVLIVEKFEFRKDDQNRDKIDYMAAELVGVCKCYAQQNRHIRTVYQGSSLIGKTAFWSDDNQKVKQLGLYNSKAAPHGMDAMRHILYYETFVLHDPNKIFRRLDDRH